MENKSFEHQLSIYTLCHDLLEKHKHLVEDYEKLLEKCDELKQEIDEVKSTYKKQKLCPDNGDEFFPALYKSYKELEQKYDELEQEIAEVKSAINKKRKNHPDDDEFIFRTPEDESMLRGFCPECKVPYPTYDYYPEGRECQDCISRKVYAAHQCFLCSKKFQDTDPFLCFCDEHMVSISRTTVVPNPAHIKENPFTCFICDKKLENGDRFFRVCSNHQITVNKK